MTMHQLFASSNIWTVRGLLQTLLLISSLTRCSGFEATPIAGAAGAVEEDEEIMERYGLPGVQHDFRIEVSGGGIECFYQKLKKGASLYLSFEVVRGADRNIDVIVRGPNEDIIEQFLWTQTSTWNKEIETGGVYQFCIDNGNSRFSSKIVYLYLVSLVHDDWQRYMEDGQNYLGGIENFTTYLSLVNDRVFNMTAEQAYSRQHVISDYYLTIGNNKYVQNFSAAMCFIIVTSAAVQIWFIRRMFVPIASPTARTGKTRA